MTELRTNHWTDNSIQNAAMRNDAERAGVAEIQDMMMYLLHGEVPAGAAGGVMGGLEVARVTGQLQSTVSPGWGWYYDSALAAPRSKFGVLLLKEAATVNHDPGDVTHPRIDIITIECPTGTDTELSVPFWQSAPQNIDTQRGAQPAITVTAGTPDASPSAPATPAGHRLLAAVQVPANATDLDAATYTDARERLGVTWRDSQRPVRHKARSTANFFLAEVLKENQGAGAGSKVQWHYSEDWPTFARSLSASGESTATLYPMLIPSGRTWWRTMPWAGRDFIIGSVTAIHGFIYLTVQRSGTATTFQQVVSIPSDSRGLEVVACKVRYRTETAFDGTIGDRYVKLYKVGVDGTRSEIATENLTIATTQGDVQELSLTMTTTPVLAEGEQLIAVVSITTSASGSAGLLRLYSVSVQFREGRTS